MGPPGRSLPGQVPGGDIWATPCGEMGCNSPGLGVRPLMLWLTPLTPGSPPANCRVGCEDLSLMEPNQVKTEALSSIPFPSSPLSALQGERASGVTPGPSGWRHGPTSQPVLMLVLPL